MRVVLSAIVVLLLAVGVAPARAEPAEPTSRAPVAVPEPSPRAWQFHRSGNVLWFVAQAWTLAVPALLLATGASARLRDLARSLGRRRLFTVAIFGALYVALNALIDLPLTFYAGYVRPHAYGLSDQSLDKWLADALKRMLIGMGMMALFLWVPYALMARSPRKWWLWTAALTVPWLLTMALVKPVVFDPLFNHFGPMHDKGLEGDILALAGRAGIDGGRIYEVDKSRDTKTVNAYVTGLGNTRRIVLWDTLLARLEPDEVLAVMGHEMGHYILGHVFTGLLLSSVGALVGLAFVHRAAGALLRSKRFLRRVGFDRLSDVASLPLILLLAEVFVLVTSPVSFAVSRHFEHESDRFALELTRDNHACASAFAKLQRDNLSIPRPSALYKFWRSTHPPIGERIEFSNAYRPWERGEPGRYDPLFRTDAGRPPAR